MENKVHSVVTVRVACDQVFMGPGVVMIMEAIESSGSMKEACKLTGISYSKAWRILNQVEQQVGYPVVRRKQGGQRGGGCFVTGAGQKLLDNYKQAERMIKSYSEEVFEKLF